MKGGYKICEMEENSQISLERLKNLRHESWLYRLLNGWVTTLYRDLLDEDFNRHEGSIDWYNTAFSVMISEIKYMRTQRDYWKLLSKLYMLGFIAICAIFICYALNWH